VIKKSKYFANVIIRITDNFNTQVTYYKGNQTFTSLTVAAEVGQTVLSNQQWVLTVADHEYVFLQLTSRADGALVRFSVQGQGDVYVPPPVPPPAVTPPGTPPGTPPNTTVTPTTPPATPTTVKKKSNLALIIGIVVGVIGLLAVIGFLVYYIMRQKRMMEERLAEEDDEDLDEDEDQVQSFKSAKRGPASKKRKLQEDSEEEEESELDEDIDDEPKPKKKL
jgi:hypothetical protein